jgi:hypothetical protein
MDQIRLFDWNDLGNFQVRLVYLLWLAAVALAADYGRMLYMRWRMVCDI